MTRTIVYRIVCGLIFVGCSSSTPSSPADSGGGGGGKPASPSNLRQFESGAEAMSEAPRGSLPAHVPDWVVAQSAYDTAFGLWQQLKPIILAAAANSDASTTATTMMAIDAALASYKADVAQMKQREAETDANIITLTVPALFELFTYPAPTDTLRLDGTFRQLQIDAEYSDWAGCSKDLSDTKTVWNRLKPLVQAQTPSRPDIHGSPTVVADMEATLQASQALIADDGGAPQDVPSLEAQAQKGLDLTDVCEQIFK